MIIKEFDGKKPQIDKSAVVAENAAVIGNVTLQKNSSVWYGAVIRGDMSSIVIGENSNVQDNATVHCSPGFPVVLGKNVTVGHNAIVHGATVMDNVIIGMHSTVLNGAVIGKNSIIAAGAVVTEGAVIPENSIAAGVPAKIIKNVSDEQIRGNELNAAHYVEISKLHNKSKSE